MTYDMPSPPGNWPMHIPGRIIGHVYDMAIETSDGIRLMSDDELSRHYCTSLEALRDPVPMGRTEPPPDVVFALTARGGVLGNRPLPPGERDAAVDSFATRSLVVPRSERWREAVSTALIGPWCDPLWESGHLPHSALGALKAEARVLHRQLVPVWRRGTRHGRVLSLDADLGGLSLYDLVAADVDHLTHTAGGVYEDERLNTVLGGLDPAERRVVFAYAEGDGATWAQAAAAAGAAKPEAFGDRVRRKAKRLADKQAWRAEQRRPRPAHG
ncbi:hypothetical protein AB0E08_49210 [Streptomyces sp. NPDC048281]|uniref:hypothetical protein n=1 Tax=Streptomyces sp. NPDC048281 TaxID=3154715 RepID=UPI00341C2A6F